MALNLNLRQLHEAGVSIWLDTLSREVLDGGEFAELIRDWSVTGATSNPTMSPTSSDLYDAQLRKLVTAGCVIRGSSSSRWGSTTSAQPPAR